MDNLTGKLLDKRALKQWQLDSRLLYRTINPAYIPEGNNLVLAANNMAFPWTQNSDSNWVHNSYTKHRTGKNDITNPRLYFVNGITNQNGTTDAGYDFTLRCSILYDGTYYPAYYQGTTNTRDGALAKEFGYGYWKVDGLTIPANTEFYVVNRRVADDGGVAGTYNVITSHASIRARQDGILSGTDDSVDYTLGGGGRGGAGTLTSSSGVITAATLSATGENYNATTSVSAWYGPAGQGQPGAEYQCRPTAFITAATQANPVVITTSKAHSFVNGDTVRITNVGSGSMTQLNFSGANTYTVANVTSTTFELSGIDGTAYTAYDASKTIGEVNTVPVSGSATNTAGVLNTPVISYGGVGHSDSAPPLLEIGGGAGNWGSAQATYGPFLILGESSGTEKSFICVVDSNGAGLSSVDGTGDLYGSHGYVEQFLHSELGHSVWKLGRAGDSASSWVSNHPELLSILDDIIADGFDMSRVIVANFLLGNDWGSDSSLTVSSAEARVNLINTEFTDRNVSAVWMGTVLPQTTSTDGLTTTANQTAASTAFDSGGQVLEYNEALRRGTSTVNYDGVIDTATVGADITAPYKFRTDVYGGTVPFCRLEANPNNRAVHYSKGVGIPYARDNLLTPPLSALPGDSLLHVTAHVTDGYTLNSGAIEQWNDQSGNSRHLTMSNATYKPNITTARKKSLFIPDMYSGSAQKALTIADFTFDHTNIAFLMVVSPGAFATAAQRVWGQYDLGATGKGQSWAINTVGKLFVYHAGGTKTVAADPATNITAGQLNVIGGWWNGGVVRFYSNGETIDSVTYFLGDAAEAIDDVAAHFSLGSLTTNNVPNTIQGLRGSVAEFVFFEPTGEADILAKQVELNKRWRVY